MRPVTINFSAAADGRAVYIDRETVLSYVLHTVNSVVSCDPTATVANRITAPSDTIRLSDISIRSAAGALLPEIFTDFPLSTGEVIFVSATGVGSVILYFTDR